MAKCPLCGSTFIIFDPARGEYYCSVCGCVVEQEEVIDHHSLIQAKRDIENAKFEWTSYKDDIKNYAIAEIRRIAANLSLPSYIVKEAEAVFSKLKSKGYIGHKYNTTEALAPACLLFAAYEFDYDLAFEDIYKFAKEEPDKIKSAFFKLFTIFDSIFR